MDPAEDRRGPARLPVVQVAVLEQAPATEGMKLPCGIRRHGSGLQAQVKVRGRTVYQAFPIDTPLREILDWRDITRGRLLQDENWRRTHARPPRRRRSLSTEFEWDPIETLPPLDGDAYVYFIQAGAFVKIGRSRDPFARMAELQCAHPIELRMVAAVSCARAAETEREIHADMVSRRALGEWFALDFAIAAIVDDARRAAAEAISEAEKKSANIV